MVREELRTASDHLRAAAVAADSDDLEERLYEHSDQLAQLATADSGPDHGRLARITQKLQDATAELDDDATQNVNDALDQIREYRKGVEGV